MTTPCRNIYSKRTNEPRIFKGIRLEPSLVEEILERDSNFSRFVENAVREALNREPQAA